MVHTSLSARENAIYKTDLPGLYTETLVVTISHITLDKKQELNKEHAQNYYNVDQKNKQILAAEGTHTQLYIYIYI
jgi:hypothetical protein